MSSLAYFSWIVLSQSLIHSIQYYLAPTISQAGIVPGRDKALSKIRLSMYSEGCYSLVEETGMHWIITRSLQLKKCMKGGVFHMPIIGGWDWGGRSSGLSRESNIWAEVCLRMIKGQWSEDARRSMHRWKKAVWLQQRLKKSLADARRTGEGWHRPLWSCWRVSFLS